MQAQGKTRGKEIKKRDFKKRRKKWNRKNSVSDCRKTRKKGDEMATVVRDECGTKAEKP